MADQESGLAIQKPASQRKKFVFPWIERIGKLRYRYGKRSNLGSWMLYSLTL